MPDEVVRFFQALGSTVLWSVVSIAIVAVVFEVDGDTGRRACCTRCFDPTGWPVATYSRTTWNKISRCLLDSSNVGSDAICNPV